MALYYIPQSSCYQQQSLIFYFHFDMYKNIEHKGDEVVCNDRSEKRQIPKVVKPFLMNCSMDVAVACYLHSIYEMLIVGTRVEVKTVFQLFFFLLFLLIHIFIPHSFHFLFSSPLVCKGVAVTSGGHLVWVTGAAQTCFRMPHKRRWHHMVGIKGVLEA